MRQPRVSLNELLRTDDVNGIRGLRPWDADEEVVRLDVAVYQGLVVNCLDASDLGGNGSASQTR